MRELTDVPLADLTTLRLGGPARRLVETASAEELVAVVADADRAGEPVLVLAGGSNVVLPDAGFDGTVALVRSRGVSVHRDGSELVRVIAQAGENWDGLVARTVHDRLAGVECLSGVPGTIGATPIQNVGAYGQDVAQTVLSVQAFDRQQRHVVTMAPAGCRFTYRSSVFKGHDRYLVLAVTYGLAPSSLSQGVRYAELASMLGISVGGRAPLTEVRDAVLTLRRGKGMVLDVEDPDTRSAGSFFTNPIVAADLVPVGAPAWPQPDGTVKTSAAWLIDRAGFGKGYVRDTVRLSAKHPLALTNPGGGTAADLLALAREIRDGVRHRFGIELVNEPVIVGAAL